MLSESGFKEFVAMHAGDDPVALVLHRDRFPGIDVALAAECIASRVKLLAKCPRWAEADILCPVAVSAEQCSSEETAAYKARLVTRILGGRQGRVADLTAGLGVDCAAFAGVSSSVLHNDRNELLSEATKLNFAALGIANAEFSSEDINSESVASVISRFGPDLIFLDPARRSADGGKVFRLADCSPNLLSLLPLPVETVVKVSPMADITQLRREIGPSLSEIHIVAASGECKEVLLRITPGFEGEPLIVKGDISFLPSEEAAASVEFGALPKPGEWIFEPDKALLKAGCRNLVCERYNLRKLGPDVHIYASSQPVAGLEPHGRWSQLLMSVPFSKRTAADVAAQYPKSELLCRGLKISTDELRSRLKLKGGGPERILALGLGEKGNWILVISG